TAAGPSSLADITGSWHAAPQVGDRRTRVERFERMVAVRGAREPRHTAGRIVQIAEDDRLRRARLGARRGDVAVANRSALAPRLELAGLNPLHAEGALFGDAGAADGDGGIELLAEGRRPGIAGPIEPKAC